MSKKTKTAKAPQVDPRVLARPRLDALYGRHPRGEPDLDALEAGVRALIKELGAEPVLGALLQRMESMPEAEREPSLLLFKRLSSPEVIALLWQRVKKRGALPVDVKMMALVALKTMGEDVDLDDPGHYFSPRDFKASDLKTLDGIVHAGARGMARHLRAARDPVEVERLMLELYRMPGSTEVVLDLIAHAEADADDLGADFAQALALASPDTAVQQAAGTALARLAAKGVRPVTPVILGLGQDRFYAAAMTDPLHPWQQSVNVAWQRAGGAVQALVFLLDFGAPWRGAIKDMFSTMGMTPQQYQHELIDKAERKMGMPIYRVSLARAQATIAAAAEANRRNRIPLPKEYNEFRHLVERWVLHPLAAVLAADTTDDELGNLPLVPDRSGHPLPVDLRNPDTQKMLGIHLADDEELVIGDFELEDGEPFESFDEIVQDVSDLHETLVGLPWWKPEWVSDYLTGLYPHPDTLEASTEEFESLLDRWECLADFLEHADYQHTDQFRSAADLRGFHFSDYLLQAAALDDDGGRHRAEVWREFLTYLVQQRAIPADTPLLAGLNAMLAEPEGVVLLDQPEPLGGEVAVWWQPADDEEGEEAPPAEPVTYNAWWLLLVLARQFGGDWDALRAATVEQPDAAAKLALLTDLERMRDADPESWDDFPELRVALEEDYARAGEWFEREAVSAARAW